MTGKQLKNSILQWAIQGKLVPQNPNDEPASVLLERIRAEKARLVKEKKIKKGKNESVIFRGEDNSYYEKKLATGEVKCIDEEIPFEIPQGWEWCRVSSLFQINPKVVAEDNTSAAFIPMEAISAGYDSEFRYYEKKWGEIKSGYTAFADNDIAFAKITPCFQNRNLPVMPCRKCELPIDGMPFKQTPRLGKKPNAWVRHTLQLYLQTVTPTSSCLPAAGICFSNQQTNGLKVKNKEQRCSLRRIQTLKRLILSHIH